MTGLSLVDVPASAPESTLEAAHAGLQNLWREHRWLHVLVDRFNGPVLQDEVDGLAIDDRPRWWPLSDPLFKETPDRSPALLALDYGCAAHARLLDASLAIASAQVAWAGQRSVCAWLLCATDGDGLVGALSRRLDVGYPTGQRIYLRYFDPRVTPRLAQILGARADSELFAPALAWCLLDREGAWSTFQAAPGLTPSVPRPQIDQAQAIDRIALLNDVAARLLKQGVRTPQAAEADIDAALVVAREHGLSDDDDVVTCAVYLRLRQLGRTSSPDALPAWIARTLASGLPLATVMNLAPPQAEGSTGEQNPSQAT